MDRYSIEKKGEFWYLYKNGNIVCYKSKDKQKVQSRYDGRIRAQHNQIDRELMARSFYSRW